MRAQPLECMPHLIYLYMYLISYRIYVQIIIKQNFMSIISAYLTQLYNKVSEVDIFNCELVKVILRFYIKQISLNPKVSKTKLAKRSLMLRSFSFYGNGYEYCQLFIIVT